MIKGNAGEVTTLAGESAHVRGVESVQSIPNIASIVASLAKKRNTVVAASGKIDHVSDGKCVVQVFNGDAMLGALTGTGCMVTTAVAAFAAVEKDMLVAAVGGLVLIGIAAEIAVESGDVKGPASFKQAFFDAVYNMTPQSLAKRIKLRISSSYLQEISS